MGYWNDCRYTGRDRRDRQNFDPDRMVLKLEDDEGNELEVARCDAEYRRALALGI